MKNKSMECASCGNSGVRYVPNGPDDFDIEFCSCREGDKLANNRHLVGGWRTIRLNVKKEPLEIVREQVRVITDGLR